MQSLHNTQNHGTAEDRKSYQPTAQTWNTKNWLLFNILLTKISYLPYVCVQRCSDTQTLEERWEKEWVRWKKISSVSGGLDGGKQEGEGLGLERGIKGKPVKLAEETKEGPQLMGGWRPLQEEWWPRKLILGGSYLSKAGESTSKTEKKLIKCQEYSHIWNLKHL